MRRWSKKRWFIPQTIAFCIRDGNKVSGVCFYPSRNTLELHSDRPTLALRRACCTDAGSIVVHIASDVLNPSPVTWVLYT